MTINYDYLKKNNMIIFEAIVGSQAYGLNIATSDVDVKYVYVLPIKMIMSGKYVEQVNDDNNNKVGYELGRFLQLIKSNNPTLLEMLNIPVDCILHKNPIWKLVEEKHHEFITSRCRWSFGEYASAQIQKARGLNKKVFNPMEPARKTPLDFCYIQKDQGSITLYEWLEKNKYTQENCGLVNLPNMRDLYAVFHSFEKKYKGIIQSDDSNEVSYSSVEKGLIPDAILYYNKDGYSSYCKTYKEYWDWVEKRNPARYEATVANGKGYDAKNIMHCHRLLDMAIEIAEGKGVIVRRPNREDLLKIRSGEREYEDVLESALEKTEKIEELYKNSNLPKEVDSEMISNLEFNIRNSFYKEQKQYDAL